MKIKSALNISAMIVLLTHLTGPVSAADKPHHKEEIVADTRQIVEFPEPIKQAMLQRMRRNLSDIHEIQRALADSDFDRAAQVAEYSLGLSSLGPHNARQAPYMPKPMQEIGIAMHAASSRVALAAQEGDVVLSLKRLSEVTARCVACHATFKAK